MKKKLILPLIATLALAIPMSAAEVVEAIVARVGDRIITRTQYLARFADADADIARSAPPAEAAARREQLKRDLLNEMLSELLLKDRADRLGLTVSQQEVTEAVNRLKVQYNLKTDEEFEKSLRESGLTRTQMESRLRDTLLTQKVFSKELRSRDEMSDKDLREKYEREKERFRRPERAKLREIVIVPTEESDPASIGRASARAVQIAQQAKEGGDFAALAKEYSDAPTRSNGGDLGEVAKGELLAALDQAVFAANAGNVIGPIQTKSGFHVIKVEQRLPSELPSFDSVKAELKRDAGEETFQRDYKVYIEKLRKEAYLQIYEQNVPKV